MADKVSNDGRCVVFKGSDNVAVALPPDVCKVSATVIAPFPNEVKSDKLAKGATSNTLISSKPVMTSASELGPPSDKPHAGTLGGVKSGTYLAEAMATSYSPDVFMEGNPVVRTFDDTTQNHKNTTGVLVPEALAALLNALSGLTKHCLIATAKAGIPFIKPGA
jgi:hypothetical protein